MDGVGHKEEEIQKLRNIISQHEEVINGQEEKIRKLQVSNCFSIYLHSNEIHSVVALVVY